MLHKISLNENYIIYTIKYLLNRFSVFEVELRVFLDVKEYCQYVRFKFFGTPKCALLIVRVFDTCDHLFCQLFIDVCILHFMVI
jgi:hypothetical protein